MSDQLHDTPATPQNKDLDDVLEIVGQLQERVAELEDENAQLRERVDELENQPSIELRGDDNPEIEDIWIGGLPVGPMVQNTRDRSWPLEKVDIYSLEDRVESIESDAVNPSDVIDTAPAEVLLPIQNLYNTVKAGGEDSLKANEARAAKVWPHFRDYADPSGGRLTLTSPKVRDILENEIGETNANSMTVKRVMEFLERYSGRDDESRIIELNTDSHPNQLECDRDDWLEATNEMMEVAKQNGAGEAVADGGREGGEK